MENKLEINANVIAYEVEKKVIVNSKTVINTIVNSDRFKMILNLSNLLDRLDIRLSKDVLCTVTEGEIESLYTNLIPYILNKKRVKDTSTFSIPNLRYISNKSLLFWKLKFTISGGKVSFDNWYNKKEDTNKVYLDTITEEEFKQIPLKLVFNYNLKDTLWRSIFLWFFDKKVVGPTMYDSIKKKSLVAAHILLLEGYYTVEKLKMNDILDSSFYLLFGTASISTVSRPYKNRYYRQFISPCFSRTIKREKRRSICNLIDICVQRYGLNKSLKISIPYYKYWNLLSKKLHPGDFSSKYKYCCEFFLSLKDNKIRKDLSKTFRSDIQKLYNNGESIEIIIKEVSKHPKEFIKRFDSILRRLMMNGDDEFKVIDVLLKLNIKNLDLVKLYDYYSNRNFGLTRMAVNKGSVGSVIAQTKKELSFLGEISFSIRDLISRKMLENIKTYCKKKNLDLGGKSIYIDPILKLIPVTRLNILFNKYPQPILIPQDYFTFSEEITKMNIVSKNNIYVYLYNQYTLECTSIEFSRDKPCSGDEIVNISTLSENLKSFNINLDQLNKKLLVISISSFKRIDSTINDDNYVFCNFDNKSKIPYRCTVNSKGTYIIINYEKREMLVTSAQTRLSTIIPFYVKYLSHKGLSYYDVLREYCKSSNAFIIESGEDKDIKNKHKLCLANYLLKK